jgi:hypothetical protein
MFRVRAAGDPDDYQQEMTMKEVLESQEAVDRYAKDGSLVNTFAPRGR